MLIVLCLLLLFLCLFQLICLPGSHALSQFLSLSISFFLLFMFCLFCFVCMFAFLFYTPRNKEPPNVYAPRHIFESQILKQSLLLYYYCFCFVWLCFSCVCVFSYVIQFEMWHSWFAQTLFFMRGKPTPLALKQHLVSHPMFLADGFLAKY